MTKKWLMYVVTGLLCCGIIGFAVANQSNVKHKVSPSDQIRIELMDVEKQMQINGQTPELIARRAELNEMLNSLKMPTVGTRVSDELSAALESAVTPDNATLENSKVGDTKSASQPVEGNFSNHTGNVEENANLFVADNQKATFEQLKMRLADGVQLSESEKVLYTELEAQFTPRRVVNPLDDQGGPDLFGYQFVDNLAGDTATFAWIELCGDPLSTEVPTSDDNSSPISWGWNFPFYTGSYASGWVNSNGQLNFGAASSSLSNANISATNTNPWISGFWDDLDPDGGGPAGTGCGGVGDNEVRFRDFGDKLVVSWTNTPHFSESTDRYNFQIIIYPDGKIKLQYNTNWVNGTTGSTSSSIHIDGPLANGLSYLHNGVPANRVISTGGRAVWFFVSGQAPTGRCCYIDQDPCAYECLDDQTPAECATLGGVFTLGATCATPCPTIQAGDNVDCAIPVPALPYSVDGNSCAFANDYDEVCPFTGSLAPDVVYAYTPAANQVVDISLCSGITDYDTKLFVYENTVTPGAPFACNDDACSAPNFPSAWVSQLEALALTGGNTYYIVVDGYFSACGNYTLTISTAVVGRCCYNSGSQCQNVSAATCASLGGVWDEGLNCTDNPCVNLCELECQPFDIIEVASVDSCQLDSFDTNGGCNNANGVYLYQPIACGDTVCGSTYTYVNCDNGLNSRDTDWYEFTITEETNVTWNIIAEFNDVLGFIIGGPCPGTILTQVGGFGPCGVVYSGTVLCLAPGTYWTWVGPAGFTGLPFPDDHQYRAWLECTPCVPPVGRCCYGVNGLQCADNTQAECATLGGVWNGALTCATPCAPCPDESVVAPGTFSASTVGDDCALRVGADYTYAVQIPTTGLWTFTLCGGSTWDTYLYLTSACCGGTTLAFNDDSQCDGVFTLQSTISCIQLNAGTYYVDVEPFSSGGGGAFTLNINQTGCVPGRCCYNNFASCSDVTLAECNTLGGVWDGGLTCATPCENPCVMACGPNDGVEAAEPGCPVGIVDDPNGGCNNVVPTYYEIECGDTVCAEAYTCDVDGSGRDTDWFRFIVEEEALVAVSATSEFNNLLFGIVDISNCAAPFFITNGFVTDCQTGWYTVSTILQPGEYVAFGAFGNFTGLPLGGSNTYRLTVNGCAVQTPCDPIADLTIHVDTTGSNLAERIQLFWTAPQDEDYKVWSTTFPNNDGNPDDGADPQWTLEDQLLGLLAGPQTWNAPAGFADAYKNYVVTAVCEPFVAPTGRCCYGDFECTDVTEVECDGLSGTWSRFLNCANDPCPPPPPANDDCGNAIEIFNGVPLAGYTTGALQDAEITTCAGTDDYSVWYVYNAPNTNLITVTTCEATYYYDTALSLWSACGGTELACNDDNCALNGLQSTITYTPAAAGPIYIRVSGFASQTGDFNLSVTQ